MSTPAKHSATDKEKKWSFTPSTFALIGVLIFIVGYAAGTQNGAIVGIVAPALGFKVETGTLDFSSVQNTYQQLKANYDGKLDPNALIAGASQGLVAAAGDVHTEYFTKAEAKEFESDLTGDIGGGIGAEIGIRDNVPTVISVIPNTPAQTAGVKAGDVLQEINEQPLAKQTVDEIVQKIRGSVGTTVKLTISRDGETIYFNITRAEITSPSVTSTVKGDVGILTITRFDEQTGDQARTEATKLKAAGVKKVILDLRDNGGGYLTAAPKVASLWLNNKLVATEKRGNTVQDQQTTDNDAIFNDMPTVILVNSGTASAAEIVTAALKDQDSLVSLVGEQTYGKGTVQTTISMSGGALLKVTIQKWYTPQDKNIDGKGLTPDKIVGLTNSDVIANQDPQLDAAIQLLDN